MMKTPLVLILVVLPALLHAQSADELIRQGDVHDKKFQTEEALEFYLPAEKLEPGNADLLVKLSRQYALRMSDLPKKEDKIASGRSALAYAERAVKAAPGECEPHLCVAICLGKLTPFYGNKEKVEASRKIKVASDKAVKLDPKNDYAWHLLGRWHQAIANMGGATRALAKMIYGEIPAASNEEAVACFKKAIALNPQRLVHQIELGRTYAMMGKKEEAKLYIQKGLGMPNREKDDPETKTRGRESLREVM